jgi:hypothetical protein
VSASMPVASKMGLSMVSARLLPLRVSVVDMVRTDCHSRTDGTRAWPIGDGHGRLDAERAAMPEGLSTAGSDLELRPAPQPASLAGPLTSLSRPLAAARRPRAGDFRRA